MTINTHLGDPEFDEYNSGFQDGWDACHKRFADILKRFPLQCAMISQRLPLHPSQPDEVIEHTDWLHAQGKISETDIKT